MRPLLCFIVAAVVASAEPVPEYSITDRYVTSPTQLVRMGQDGAVREVWCGMDPARGLHIPLFLELSVTAQVQVKGQWRDLRQYTYDRSGTRPGYIRMRSTDDFVSIEVTSRQRAKASPIFIHYTFAEPVDFRVAAAFKHPEFTKAARADEPAGAVFFDTAWRNVNSQVVTVPGPRLAFATLPTGTGVSATPGGFEREIRSTRDVVLVVDATEPALDTAGRPYVEAWREALGGIADPSGALDADRVSLVTDNHRLDRMFASSIDAIRSHQFASGDVMADLFFYRDSWLRDGTYTMTGLALAGDHAAVDRYFDFWSKQRDFSVGGEREAQQAAIAITGMWYYSRLRPEGDAFLGRMWPYISYYADYFGQRVAKEGMLHLAEEWICFIPAPSSWPNAEVYSGLRAAAKAARALGHSDRAQRWDQAADTLRAAFRAQAYDTKLRRIIPMAGSAGERFRDPDFPDAENRNGPMRDERVDAGMLIIGRLDLFGRDQSIVPVDDPMFTATAAQVRRVLENPDHSIFRFGPNPASPHAPQGELDCWPIIGSWAAQDAALLGRTDIGWRYLTSGILNKRGYSPDKSADYLPEFWDRSGVPDKPLIVWSHGDFVTSVMLLMLGINTEPRWGDLGLAPSLPEGMHVAHLDNFRFRDWRLDFEFHRSDAEVEVKLHAHPQAAGSLRISLPQGRHLELRPGATERFTVYPGQYALDTGRHANLAERAAVTVDLLGSRDAAGDLSKMTPEQLEDLMQYVERAFTPTAQ
jgi:hypothetical protein